MRTAVLTLILIATPRLFTASTGVRTGGANYLLKGHDLKLQLHLMHGDEGDRVVARVQTLF